MSAEVIINAIGDIDEELINDCNELRSKYSFKSRPYVRWLSMAAGLVLVSFIGVFAMLKPAEINPVSLSGSEWWHQKNPIIFTERPEKEQVAVKPEPTVLSTATPISTSVPQTEVTTAPVEEEINWMQYIAGLESERGLGAEASPGTILDETSANIVPGGEFIGYAGNWTYEVIFGGTSYIARDSNLTNSDIGGVLGDYTLSAYESITDVLFSGPATIYAINNVATDAAIAVKVGENYYVLINQYYSANSFSEFIADFNLIFATELNEIALFRETDGTLIGKCSISNSPDIWNTLHKNVSYPVDVNSLGHISDINISMSSNLYSFYNISFALYNEGHIYFDILGLRQAFYIGEDVVHEIKEMYSNVQNNDSVASKTEEPFSVYIHDSETGETIKQYYDMGTADGELSTDAWFPE